MAHSIAARVVVGALAVVIVAAALPAKAASGNKASPKYGAEASRAFVLEGRRQRARLHQRRIRGPRIAQPIGRSYVYYDYPYYYSRGHYPTHIAQYVYYVPGGLRRDRSYRARYRGRCANRAGRC